MIKEGKTEDQVRIGCLESAMADLLDLLHGLLFSGATKDKIEAIARGLGIKLKDAA